VCEDGLIYTQIYNSPRIRGKMEKVKKINYCLKVTSYSIEGNMNMGLNLVRNYRFGRTLFQEIIK
jgi:hypothetical protein